MHMDGQRMNKTGKKLLAQGLGLIFPPRCPVCDELLEPEEHALWGKGIHENCKKQLVCIEPPVCFRCGKPVESSRRELCYDCQKGTKHRGFSQGRALFLYQGKMKAMMYRFKYQNRREYAYYFAKYAAKQYESWMQSIHPDVVIAVPIHKSRKRQRGYNQAEVFAKELADKMGLAWEKNLIVRVKKTKPMKNLDDRDRKKNLKNAFQIDDSVVKYNKILVVDDIFTTGSTINEVGKLLLSAGAKEIYFLCICIGKGC